MAKLTLNTIGSRYGSIDALNDNFDAIEAAFENTFSRDGTGPNTLEATIDANSQRIINLPDPVGNTEPATKGWIIAQPDNAASSAAAAAASFDSFDDRYLGAKATIPTTDNDGDALLVGALYFNSVSNKMFVWEGSVWQNVVAFDDIAGLQAALDAKVDIASGTASGLTLTDGYTEEVFAVTGTTPALSPTNGSIQTWTLSANSTPTAGTWAAGQSITLMIDDGTARTITWSSVPVVWVSNTTPTLATTGFTVIVLWKVGTTIYGALTGQVA